MIATASEASLPPENGCDSQRSVAAAGKWLQLPAKRCYRRKMVATASEALLPPENGCDSQRSVATTKK